MGAQLDYSASSFATSAFVLVNTILKQAGQNRLVFENAVRGFGMSKHLSPLKIAASQPAHSHSLPAAATVGRPADPLIREGILFCDILKLLDFSC
jgi:hypothetical protein